MLPSCDITLKLECCTPFYGQHLVIFRHHFLWNASFKLDLASCRVTSVSGRHILRHVALVSVAPVWHAQAVDANSMSLWTCFVARVISICDHFTKSNVSACGQANENCTCQKMYKPHFSIFSLIFSPDRSKLWEVVWRQTCGGGGWWMEQHSTDML